MAKSKVTAAEYAAVGRALLERVQAGTYIPYVAGGMDMMGMDCQGLCEFLLMQCGVAMSECNLAGSNAHWRACVWRGTPEECAAAFGAVPAGAWLFIVNADDSGAPVKYRGDGYGNASHMGVCLGDCALHASASRGCVAESKFRGKTIPNGGWNMVGLPPWVDYGVTLDGEGDGSVASDADAGGSSEGGEVLTIGGAGTGGASESAGEVLTGKGFPLAGSEREVFAKQKSSGSNKFETLDPGAAVARVYDTVQSPNGQAVRLRKSASKQEPVWWLVNPGARVRVEKLRGEWALVTALCSDGHQRRAYMMAAFLVGGGRGCDWRRA